MRVSRWVAGLGFLAMAGVARAESPVPMNYVDDFGGRAGTLPDRSAAAAAARSWPDARREQVASVNGATGDAGTLSAPGGEVGLDPEREQVASVNGAGGGGGASLEARSERVTVSGLARRLARQPRQADGRSTQR